MVFITAMLHTDISFMPFPYLLYEKAVKLQPYLLYSVRTDVVFKAERKKKNHRIIQ